jgi:hypothetical protein
MGNGSTSMAKTTSSQEQTQGDLASTKGLPRANVLISPRRLAGDFVFGTVSPLRYWDISQGILVHCDKTPSRYTRGKINSHQKMVQELAKRIGSFIFVKDLNMREEDIVRFLPVEILDLCCPRAAEPRHRLGKKKMVKIKDERDMLSAELSRHKARMKSQVFAVSTGVILAKLETAHRLPSLDSTDEDRHQFWESLFSLHWATILYSNLMSALDVQQTMRTDVPGNDKARMWLQVFFSSAIDARFRHLQYCDSDMLHVCQWRKRLEEIKTPGRIGNEREELEAGQLNESISKTVKTIRGYWKAEIMKPWAAKFLDITKSKELALELEEIPVCSTFGSSVKPRLQSTSLDDGDDSDSFEESDDIIDPTGQRYDIGDNNTEATEQRGRRWDVIL